MKPLNPADYPTYNVGDQVTIRQWDDMESEFGLDEYGGIKVPKTFTKFMKKYCGQTFPIVHVNRYPSPKFDSYFSTVLPWFFLPLCLNNPNSNPFRPLLSLLILFSKVVTSFDSSRNNRSFLPHHPS